MNPIISVPITAIRQRINRKLRPQGLALYVHRGAYDAQVADTGGHFIAETLGRHQRVVEGHVDLGAKARELGLLKPYERVVDVQGMQS
jgi:hypothetical protein